MFAHHWFRNGWLAGRVVVVVVVVVEDFGWPRVQFRRFWLSDRWVAHLYSAYIHPFQYMYPYNIVILEALSRSFRWCPSCLQGMILLCCHWYQTRHIRRCTSLCRLCLIWERTLTGCLRWRWRFLVYRVQGTICGHSWTPTGCLNIAVTYSVITRNLVHSAHLLWVTSCTS
jgi:hypothetical protein